MVSRGSRETKGDKPPLTQRTGRGTRIHDTAPRRARGVEEIFFFQLQRVRDEYTATVYSEAMVPGVR